MSTDPVGSVRLELKLAQAQFERDIKAAADSVKGASNKMSRSMRRFDKAANRATRQIGRLGVAALAAAGPTALGFLAKRSLETADNIGKTADKIGLSTDALQELRFAAGQAGVEQRTLDLAMQRFSRRVGEAAQGTGEMLGVVKQYGIAVRDTEGKQRKLEDVMSDYADVIKNAESEQEQLRLAFKAFDSEGAALVNLLRGGSAELENMREQAQSLGIVLNEGLVRGAEDASDKLDILSRVVSIQLTEAFTSVAPEIAAAAEFLTKFGQGIKNIRITDQFNQVEVLEKNLRALNEAAAGSGGVSGFFLRIGNGDDLAANIERETAALEIAQDRLAELIGQPLVRANTRPEAKDVFNVSEFKDAQREVAEAIQAVASDRRKLEDDTLSAASRAVHEGILQESIGMLEQAKADLLDAARRVSADVVSNQPLFGPSIAELQQNKQGAVDPFPTGPEEFGPAAGTIDEIREAQKKYNDAVREGAQAFESTRTPAEQLQTRYERLKELLADGQLPGGQETFNRAIRDAQDTFKESFSGDGEEGPESLITRLRDAVEQDNTPEVWAQRWGAAIDRFSSGIGDAVAGAIFEQQNLSDAMQAVLKGVAKQVISTLVEIGVRQVILAGIEATAKTTSAAAGAAAVATQTAAVLPLAAAQFAAWSPVAAAVSLASFGTNSVPAIAGITATGAAATGLSLAGIAHQGLDFVPNEGTFLLQKGEMVLNPGNADALRGLLKGGEIGQAGEQSGQTIVNNLNLSGFDGQSIVDILEEQEDVILNMLARANRRNFT